ncbi:MAG: hypothetical protein RL701_3858 [Pseudomonadota bacterium]|jgi:hypothetical protein
MQQHEPLAAGAQADELPLYVPIAQLAALLGIPYSTVACHARTGRIPSFKINGHGAGRRYVHRDVVRELLSRGAA